MKKLLVILFASTLMACGRGGGAGGGVIVFDYKTNYPASDLTLADVADVEFIPIGTSDDFLMSGITNAKAGEAYVSDQFVIYKDNNQGQLYVFDRQGNPIRKIGQKGRGPGEYLWIQHFVGVDEASDEVYIYDGMLDNLLVYSLTGEFKRDFKIESNAYLGGMQLLNDEEIICFDQMGYEGFFTVSRQDGKIVRKFPIDLIPYAHDPDGRMAYPNLFANKNGMTLFDLRTDTIYRMTNEGEMIPTLVDITKYPSPSELYGPDNAQFLPLFETERYIMGNILTMPWITPDVKGKNYVYDKQKGRWFTLAGEDSFSIRELGMAKLGIGAINGQLNIERCARTLNPGYATILLQPGNLLENRDKWESKELEAVLKGVTENDNPILMLITFK
ncbi:MAG: 6-bladed beta-propeller [Rikenellaceae bacterium]|jgi:hypothetical protein|nr:6-bladed beta-propeller [Rikenellaceae bacterium]